MDQRSMHRKAKSPNKCYFTSSSGIEELEDKALS
jgi:hypothetical protein